MNRSVSAGQIGGFALKIKTIQSNVWLATLTNGVLNADGTAAVFSLTKVGQDLYWLPPRSANDTSYKINPGQFYKAQLAYIQDGEQGYFSTVGVIKCANIHSDALKLLAGSVNLLNNQSTLSPFHYSYTGVYDYADDPMEKVYTYRFVLTSENGEIVEDSGKLLHNATKDNLNTSVDTYTFVNDIIDDGIYYLQYSITTVNGLELSTPAVGVVAAEEFTVDTQITMSATNVFDDGYVRLDFDGPSAINGRFRIYRQDVRFPRR
jgi:hypothetical protein